MTTREDAAREFAEAMGWNLQRDETPASWGSPPEYEFKIGPLVPVRPEQPNGPKRWTGTIVIPAPGAPLHEHLAFVGRVAEALGPNSFMNFGGAWKVGHAPEWRVSFSADGHYGTFNGFASDLSWAALIAATAARKAGK